MSMLAGMAVDQDKVSDLESQGANAYFGDQVVMAVKQRHMRSTSGVRRKPLLHQILHQVLAEAAEGAFSPLVTEGKGTIALKAQTQNSGLEHR